MVFKLSDVRVLAVASDGTAGEHAGVTVFVCVDVELDSECVIFLSMIIIALKTSPPPTALRLITAACTCGYRTMTILVPTGLCHIRRTEITAKWSVKLIIE